MMYKSEVYGKGGIYAKIVADSIANDVRVTTLELRYPRFIHSEFLTHRMLSRNSSSSRAVPVEKMIEQVKNKPATPIHWGKNQPGMQADERHNAPSKGIEEWHNACGQVCMYVNRLRHHGFHKQIVNRLLEPFQFITTVVTATEWENFFKLRLHPDAQPEIQELARVMKEAMEVSEPRLYDTQIAKWHTPYVDIYSGEFDVLARKYGIEVAMETVIKCSVARCARVSYLNHDKSNTSVEKDILLHDRLLHSCHFSPFEHIATPMKEEYDHENGMWEKGITHSDKDYMVWSGNFKGWIQYRHLIGE